MTSLAWIVASLGGIGRLRPAPGTWGSAIVLPVVLLGPEACLGLALVLTGFGIPRPGPVGWADRRHGALGVMLDDVFAGALAALLLLALRLAGVTL